MMFIVTLIALLIERFFDWSHIRHWSWYNTYQGAVLRKIPGKSPYLTLAITVLPLLLVAGLIDYLLDGVWYGVARLVFDLIIFIYCLGPQNLWVTAFANINAVTDGNKAGEPVQTTVAVTEHHSLLSSIFVEANQRVFAVVFWFVVLGPVGALLYRMMALSAGMSAKSDVNPAIAQSAQTLVALLDWIPLRIFTFLFALGGHFTRVLNCFRKYALQGLSSNETIVTECGIAAISHEESGKTVVDANAGKGAIALLDRVFLIVLVIIAILAFWG